MRIEIYYGGCGGAMMARRAHGSTGKGATKLTG